MSNQAKVTRRKFFHRAAVTAGSLLLAGCAGAPMATPTQAPTAAPAKATQPPATSPAKTAAPTQAPTSATKPVTGGEAPQLAELVKAGKLPPLSERLPKEPKLVNELAAKHLKLEIGRYGGTFRMLTLSPNDDPDVYMMCNEPLLNSPSLLAEEITGNLVKAWTVNADGTEFTFTLREGHKWSDGQPVTTEDVRFAIEDVQLNKDLTTSVPQYLRSSNDAKGEPLRLEVIDNYTFKIKFAKPYGGFPLSLAIRGWNGYHDLIKPKHYLMQFHAKYTPEEKLKPLWEAAKLENWKQLFALKDCVGRQLTHQDRIGIPKLHPWVLVSVKEGVYTYERNPYYHKIDAAWNQLPYVDKIVSTVVPDIEMINLKLISGETDFSRRWPALNKMPLYRENEKKGGFRTLLGKLHISPADVWLNLTYKDPVWRQVVQDVRFRRALGYALDRKEIIDAVYFGFAKPSSWAPSEYSPEKANKLLDEMGMNKRDSAGFRLGPDGKTFTILFEVYTASSDIVPVTELVVQMWNQVGIKTSMKVLETQLFNQRNAANEIQATVFWCASPMWYYQELGLPRWGGLWLNWYTSGGTRGEEPPADVKILYDKFYSMLAVPIEQGAKVFEEVKKMMYDNVYSYILLEDVKQPYVVNAKLGNIPESDDPYPIGVNFAAEQMFFRQ